MGNQPLIMGKYIGEKKPGQTRVLRNALLPDDAEHETTFQGCDTLAKVYEKNFNENPQKPYLGTRKRVTKEDGKEDFGEYVWKSFGDCYRTSRAIANYFMHHNLSPKTDTPEGHLRFVAIYAKNREEWVETDLGCMMTGITVVTLYDTLGKDATEYILDQTHIKTLVCSADKIKLVADLKKEGKIQKLSHIIYFDKASQDLINLAQANGITLITYDEVVNEGSKLTVTYDEVTPETVYTLCYTSGTTGMPKGAMLMHRNFMANIASFTKFDGVFTIYPDDVYISYLPLAHVFERLLMTACMAFQIEYGFYQGDVMKLRDDLAVLKPTLMVSVPRLFTRFYDVMQAKIKELTGVKRRLCDWGVQKKLHNLETYGKVTHTVYDRLVFNKFRDFLGGRIRQMITGSAPISKEILNFLKIAFCCPINEGYGQTECAAPASITWTQDPSCGHVGAPFPACDFKLVDVPEMNYTSEDVNEQGENVPRGEICYKGPNCFKGYFNKPEATRETIDEEGWVHTGDIGMFLPNGTIKIIDRKKNIFKLSQGEYVQPEKIENQLVQSLYVQQIFVYGDSLQNNLVAIVVPEKRHVEKWASENGVGGSYDEILVNEKTNKFFLEEIKTLSKQAGFFGFEIPLKVHLTSTVFTAENDLLTPTFKLKRNEAKAFFFKEIKNLYGGTKLQGEDH